MNGDKAVLCRIQTREHLFPEESLSLAPDTEVVEGETVLLEPRIIAKTYVNSCWPQPQMLQITDGKINLHNNTGDIITLHKNDHICQIFKTKSIDISTTSIVTPKSKIVVAERPFSKDVVVDPDSQLTESERRSFRDLNLKFDELFEPVIGRYNDSAGKVRARVNLGKVAPPTRKLQVPQYDKKNLDLLQTKFDELEQQGVFVRPEDVNIAVEHVSPSFLVKKSSGGHRLVTAFTSLGQYCKTLPVTMSTVDSVLRMLGKWKYIVSTDLRDAFYQIPLEHSSMKWCGTMTPYRGLRVYQVAAQGMPGSSEALEEMLCTVLGEFVQQGFVAKIADDLNVGGFSLSNLSQNWSVVMNALHSNGLKLKGPKTIIVPLRAQILGWDWCEGKIAASKHKISALVSCDPPKTVTGMRSFIGAFKTFNRVVKRCTSYLSVMEELIAGKQKKDGIAWSDVSLQAFKSAQKALENTPSICLPRPSDELVIVHDGCNNGIGSILFVRRDKSIHLGHFFSAKLKSHHQKWLPCEIEALSITASIQHFSPFIRESENVTQVLTDSRPCVQSWHKLLRGEFSTSARVATFLSTLSEYNVELQHLKGKANLPSDFQSRNPPECSSKSCQICKFIDDTSDSVVRKISVDEILAGHAQVPYSNRATWKDLQLGCNDLKRVHAHLSSGTRPTQKSKQTTVKRYLQKVVIGKDGLLVVIQTEPFLPRRELIVVPQQVVLGFMTSLHLRLNHPTENQLLQVFQRGFFALRVQHFAKVTLQNCDLCQSLKVLPKELHQQSTVDIPITPCRSFAADVIRRYRQKIFIIRDTFSSFTCAELIPSEDAIVLRESLCRSISLLRPSPQISVVTRVDNAPGFLALKDDMVLTSLNIFLDLGRRHNKNKNPVIDKCITELISELLRINPEGGQTNSIQLAHAVNQLNARIRGRGLTAWEIVTQRDTETGVEIELHDKTLSDMQFSTRKENQVSSAKSKACGGKLAQPADISVGSLVYIKDDHSKLKARDRYIVVKLDGINCSVKKLLKNNIRDKEYQLKSTEVFPVNSNIIHNESYLRGWDGEIDDEDEVEDVVPPVETGVTQPSVLAENDFSVVDTAQTHELNAANTDVETTTGAGDSSSYECGPFGYVNTAVVEEEFAGEVAERTPAQELSSSVDTPAPRRGDRNRRKPEWLKDYVED